jgi:hypothetical protein
VLGTLAGAIGVKLHEAIADETPVMLHGRTFRHAGVITTTLALLLLAHVGVASAATAPSLSSPANNPTAVTEGTKITFKWTGSLQGDPDTLSSSFFRVELAATDDVKNLATQASWEDVLVNFARTNSGSNTKTAEMGAPPAGTTYSWRVCAWGVVDDSVSPSLEQLPNGCSNDRTFTTKEPAAADTTPEKITVPGETHTQAGKTITKTVRRKGKTITKPAPNKTVVLDTPESAPKVEPTAADDLFGSDGGASATELPKQGMPGEPASSKGGLGGLTSALGGSLPFLPIPFWTLALMCLAIPLALLWRRSTLGMFEWPDEAEFQELPLDELPLGLKASQLGADGAPSQPDHERVGV